MDTSNHSAGSNNSINIVITVVMTVVVTILLVCIVAYSLGIVQPTNDGGNSELLGPKCYECVTYTNFDQMEIGLPHEVQCEKSPKNFRQCLQGQGCAIINVTIGNARRFQRSCGDTRNQTSCESNSHLTSCFCNYDFCMK